MFLRARIKLTLFYVLALIIILAAASWWIYAYLIEEIEEKYQHQDPYDTIHTLVLQADQANLRNHIILIDGSIVGVIFVISYFLSGKTLEPISKNYEIQKQFLADASHELRTPLAILKTDLEVALRGKKLAAANKKVLLSNLEEVNRMSRMVEDLLLISRFDSRQEWFRFENIDLGIIVNQCADMLKSYAHKRKLWLTLEIGDNILVRGDKDRLKQAVLNVLKNAVDYSPGMARIEIRVFESERKAVLKVTDQGIGIGRADLLRIFDRFYRADRSRQRKSAGSGLGLSIVKWIVDKHKGSIDIKSRLGKGTAVTIALPLISSS